MFNGSNCDRKSQLSGILTEPLNPRDTVPRPPSQERKGISFKIRRWKEVLYIYIFV